MPGLLAVLYGICAYAVFLFTILYAVDAIIQSLRKYRP